MKVVRAIPPQILQTPTNPVAASSVRRHMVRPQRKERRVMKLIAQIPGWSLYDRLSPSGGWISLKLVASGKLPKRHWWLGFNGTRMSRTAMPSSSSSTNPISMRGSSIRCQD